MKLTLNTDMDIVLRLLSLSRILVGFGEGVCKRAKKAEVSKEPHFQDDLEKAN
jgi:hypothetical protein